MPRFLNPGDWAQLVQGLPRETAALALLVLLSMLVVGLRAQRFYLCLTAALLAGGGGSSLAEVLDIAPWYLALPLAAVAGALTWALARYAMSAVVGLTAACACGAVVAEVLRLGSFWLGFSGGLMAGVTLAILARRFAAALWFAAMGAAGACVAVGAVVRASAGPLSPGGYMRYPALFVGVGAALFVGSVLIQARLDNQSLPADGRNGHNS